MRRMRGLPTGQSYIFEPSEDSSMPPGRKGVFNKDGNLLVQNKPQLDKRRLPHCPTGPTSFHRTGRHAGAVNTGRALSVTTQSRSRAGLNATAMTQSPLVPLRTARHIATTREEPIPVYPDPARPHSKANIPIGDLPTHPFPPRSPITSPPPRNPAECQTLPTTYDRNSEVLATLHEFASNYKKMSQTIIRTRREVEELRSATQRELAELTAINARSSRKPTRTKGEVVTKRPESQRATLSAAETPDSKPTGEPQRDRESSRRSTRPREQVVSERLKLKPTTPSEVKTLGLKPVTEFERDRESHYELTSQNRTMLRVLEWSREVAASTRTGQPVTKPSNQPSSEQKKQDSLSHTNASRTPDKRREPPLLARCYPSSTRGRSQSPPTRRMKSPDQCQPHSPPEPYNDDNIQKEHVFGLEPDAHSVMRDISIREAIPEVTHRSLRTFVEENIQRLAVLPYYRVQCSGSKETYDRNCELEKKAKRRTSKPDSFRVEWSIHRLRDFSGSRDVEPEPPDRIIGLDNLEQRLIQPIKYCQPIKTWGRRVDLLWAIHVDSHLSREATNHYESHIYRTRWTLLQITRYISQQSVGESALRLAFQPRYRVHYPEYKGVYRYTGQPKRKADQLTSKLDGLILGERIIEGTLDHSIDKMTQRCNATVEALSEKTVGLARQWNRIHAYDPPHPRCAKRNEPGPRDRLQAQDYCTERDEVETGPGNGCQYSPPTVEVPRALSESPSDATIL